MSYDRLTELPSGIVVSKTLGTTIARLLPKQYGGLELPDPSMEQLIIADSSGNRLGAIDMAGESECYTGVTEVSDLNALVNKATSVWRSLVNADEIVTVQTRLREVREEREHITPSGLIVHSDEHPPVNEFVGYAASPEEMDALDKIRRAVLETQVGERPGDYL